VTDAGATAPRLSHPRARFRHVCEGATSAPDDEREIPVTDENELIANEFERHRPRLRAVAYRMLGSVSDAEDAVQESWLRLGRSDPEAIANLPGWLTAVVARVCLDMLRARRSRREDYV